MDTAQFGWMFGIAVGLVALFVVLMWASGFGEGSVTSSGAASRSYFIETRRVGEGARYESSILEQDTRY